MKRSMIEIAYDTLSKQEQPISFLDLWKVVADELQYNESQFNDNIASFYTDLSLDGRFLNLEGNHWDLRARHTFSESVLDTDSLVVEDDDEEEEDELDEESSLEDQEENEAE